MGSFREIVACLTFVIASLLNNTQGNVALTFPHNTSWVIMGIAGILSLSSTSIISRAFFFFYVLVSPANLLSSCHSYVYGSFPAKNKIASQASGASRIQLKPQSVVSKTPVSTTYNVTVQRLNGGRPVVDKVRACGSN